MKCSIHLKDRHFFRNKALKDFNLNFLNSVRNLILIGMLNGRRNFIFGTPVKFLINSEVTFIFLMFLFVMISMDFGELTDACRFFNGNFNGVILIFLHDIKFYL